MNHTPLEQKIIRQSYDLINLPQSRHKHFSFLVKRNKILNVAWNHSRKTHPHSKQWDYTFQTIHSELALVISSSMYKNEFKRLKMYNVRITSGGKIAMAAPCVTCQVMLEYFGFNELYFTNNSGEFERWI